MKGFRGRILRSSQYFIITTLYIVLEFSEKRPSSYQMLLSTRQNALGYCRTTVNSLEYVYTTVMTNAQFGCLEACLRVWNML